MQTGMWIFHCHIDWHLVAGLALTFKYIGFDAPISADPHQAIKASDACMQNPVNLSYGSSCNVALVRTSYMFRSCFSSV